QEAFFNGLENTTKLELSRFFKKDFHHIYNSIPTTELMLIEMMQKNTPNSYANYKPDNKNRKEYKAHGNRYSRENNNEKENIVFYTKILLMTVRNNRKQNNYKGETKEA
ncbi:hypothetical protein DMUE_5754, partial [Dictyocoela muelleri]